MAAAIDHLWSLVSVKSSEEKDFYKHRVFPHRSYDLLWQEYFRDPSLWWDNRNSKTGPAYPDFKHKITKETLWINGCNPSWVSEELERRELSVSEPSAAKNQKVILGGALLCNDDGASFVASLRACAKNKDLCSGTRIHDDILKKGLLKRCLDALVTMYAKCGELAKAKELLDMHKSRDVFAWTALIAGYARQRQSQDALNCFEQMQREGLSPDAVTFASVLKVCGSMKAAEKGKEIHDEIARQGLLKNDIVLGTALVDMYAKCGALAQAQGVLEELSSRDVISWNTLIAGYTQHGQGEQALNCIDLMQREGLSPNRVTFISILRACGTKGDAEKGKEIHDEIVRQGLLGNDVIMGTALVDMYAKCGALAKAQRVLEELPSRDAVSWSALIAGYAQYGQGDQALNCFEQMQCDGLSPDATTFACVLKACGSIGAVDKGEQIHDELSRRGLLGTNVVLGTALVDMYAKCGALTKAQQVLEGLPFRDVVSWNTIIAAHAEQGQGEQALNCFKQMQHEGISPDAVTFICILKACGTIGAVDKGEEIHDELVRQGFLGNNTVLGTALVDMYVKCGAFTKAAHVLEELPVRDVLSWSSLIAGYAQDDQGEQALRCFERMQKEGLSPDAVTFTCILKACGIIANAGKGRQIHEEIVRQGLLENNTELLTALVDMYAKCGALAKAQQVLEGIPSRNVASWNALIAGYAQQGQGEQALNCFQQMQDEGFSPDRLTFACILKACGTIAAADRGEKIHDEIVKQGLLENDIVLGTALVDMYVTCGALATAARVLEELPSRNVVSWNTLIAGYVQQGHGEQALKCFIRLQCEGLSPNAVTFTCILEACGAAAAVDIGEKIHDEIARRGLLENDIVLGTALVDMYAKCGALAKAQGVLDELPSRNVASWNALIAGYAQQGLGKQALDSFDRMQHEGLSPDAATLSYILNACNHLGLVEDGHRYFVTMSTKYGVKPNLGHYTCMVDLFARAGHLEKAVMVIQEMPSSEYSAVWHTLLSACLKWGDVNVGRWAFEQTVQIDRRDGAAYVLMANMYAAAGMQEAVRSIEAMRRENKAWEKPGCTLWIDTTGNAQAFFVRDTKHIQS